MRIKFIVPILLLYPIFSIGQNRINEEIKSYKEANSKFEKIDLFSENKEEINEEINKTVKEATLASLSEIALEKIMENNYQTIEIKLPYKNNIITIELYKVNPFTEDFKINTDKSENIPYAKGKHYRGAIKDEINSVASFNFFQNEMNGIVSSLELGNLNIGKLFNNSKNSPDYIIYSDLDLLIPNEFKCNTADEYIPSSTTNNLNRIAFSPKCVSSYFEIGYQAFQANGSNLTTTTNWITSIFNNSQTLFNFDGISISLKTIFIWTSDDYYSTSSNYILPAFTNIRPYFDGDIGFIADIDPGQLGGQAFGIGGLCTDRKFAYGDLVLNYNQIPIFSQPVYVITHELGHVLGSHHTHACVWNGNNTALDGCDPTYGGCPTPITYPGTQGTMMSYCFPNFSLGFGLQPANAIIEHINSAECLKTNCSDSCINTIGSINVLNTTQTSTDIQWIDYNNTNTSWEISVVPYGNSPIWTTVTNNLYSLSNLIPDTYYEVIIRGNCPVNNAIYPKHSIIFATQANNCNNSIIYDTGLNSAGYGGREHIIRTLVPTVPNKKIKLTFNSLNLVPWEAWIFVYDGLNNNGPLLNVLTGSFPFLAYGFGNNFYPAGNTFESQDPSGALTLEFFSNDPYPSPSTPQNSGWIATVSCLNTLGNEEFNDGYIDYTYSPNPVKDILKVKSKDEIKRLSIFTIEGKKILTIESNKTDENIDLSSFETGTYIIKLEIDKHATAFKIVKE